MKPLYASLIRWRWPFLAGVLLIGTISYVVPEPYYSINDLSSGQFLLETDDQGERKAMKGPVYFEYTGQEKTLMDTRIFKLHFVQSASSEAPGFGFLIPLSSSDEKIDLDKYWVDHENKGFMNGFGSVFGYADLRGTNPSLYFTESGSIAIIATSPEEVSGNIDMVLDDGSGNSIHLEGSFRALPLPSNLSL
jgi:hypothetical protein